MTPDLLIEYILGVGFALFFLVVLFVSVFGD